MSARDDYPQLANADHDEADCPYADHGYCTSSAYDSRLRESRAALDEIDRLRGDVAIAERARSTERKSSQQNTWWSWNQCLDHILVGARRDAT